MKLDGKELHRMVTKAVGSGILAAIFRLSEKTVHSWSCRSPQIRGEPPIEKVRMIMKELAAVGDIELAALVATYVTQDVPGLMVVRIYKEEV